MKNFWTRTFRQLAAGAIVAGATAFSSAMGYAAQLAFDSASDPVYSDGWQAGDNGGFGFTPWNFDASYTFQGTVFPYASPGFKAIDNGLQAGTHYSNPFNNIGRAWDFGTTPTDDGAPHIGRGFPTLQVGQTLTVTIDNPTKRQFFKGYFVRLNGGSGGSNGNVCNLGYNCSGLSGTSVVKSGFDRFEYFTNGEWKLDDAASASTGVFDTDTAAAGAILKWTRTGGETYDFSVQNVGAGSPSYSASRTFSNPGPGPDWIEFVFFNPVTDTGTPPTTATDFYVSNMEITGVPEPGTGALLVLGAGMLAGAGRPRRRTDE
jgi:hypothetical protein